MILCYVALDVAVYKRRSGRCVLPYHMYPKTGALRATEGRMQSASLGYHYVALDASTLLYMRFSLTRNRSSSTRIFFLRDLPHQIQEKMRRITELENFLGP